MPGIIPCVLFMKSFARECDLKINNELISDLEMNGIGNKRDKWLINYQGEGNRQVKWVMAKSENVEQVKAMFSKVER